MGVGVSVGVGVAVGVGVGVAVAGSGVTVAVGDAVLVFVAGAGVKVRVGRGTDVGFTAAVWLIAGSAATSVSGVSGSCACADPPQAANQIVTPATKQNRQMCSIEIKSPPRNLNLLKPS